MKKNEVLKKVPPLRQRIIFTVNVYQLQLSVISLWNTIN